VKEIVKKGATSHTLLLFIQDSSSATGAGKTGIVFNSAGLTCYYVRPAANPVAVTLATQTVTGAYSSGGFVEIDATNMPGFYRFDIPDAAVAAGASKVGVLFKGATNMAPLPLEIQLVDFDPNDAAGLGLSRLDAAITTRSSHSAADVWTSATRTLTAFGFSVTVGTNNDKTGYSLTAAEETAIADALLKRDMSVVSGEASRSPLNALRALRNKASISGTTLTVTKEDDTASAWTATITTDAAAQPITAVDPA